MAFPLPLVRFTARRSGDSDLPVLYPRLLRDNSVWPKIGIAIEYFESMVGKERRELDGEVLVHFFGDHKLARCMVACLARTYRFRAPRIEEVVSATAWKRLAKLGLLSPVALRLHLFDDVNARAEGFLDQVARDPAFARLEQELRLRPGALQTLLRLDAPEHAILTRVGPRPEPADVAASYNFGVLETLLRHAARVSLTLTGAGPTDSPIAQRVRQVCAGHDVGVELRATGRALTVTLAGRQDAMGVWARHGRRVARATLELVERAREAVLDGDAIIALRDRQAMLRFTPEVLEVLSGGGTPQGSGWDDDLSWPDALWPAVAQALRSPSQSAGFSESQRSQTSWGARRLPDPQAWSSGVVVPALALRGGALPVTPPANGMPSATAPGQTALLCPVRSTSHAARLAAVSRRASGGDPLLFVGKAQSLAPLRAAGAWTAAVESTEPAAVAGALRRAWAPVEEAAA